MSESHGEEPVEPRKYDLAERTAKFGEAIIDFAKSVPRNVVTLELIPQLVSAATSVGANYAEAGDAFSRREFRHKIGICQKEARETTFWLRMVAKAEPEWRDAARDLWREARELHLIFCAIRRNSPRQ